MVLVLNASYVPIAIVSNQRAVSLLLRGVVEGVGEDIAAVMHSPSTKIYIPSVLRLKHYRNIPRRKIPWSRSGVLKRDAYTCIYCGARAGEKKRGITLSPSDFTVDHIVPISRGGESSWTNTACACRWCNKIKGNRLPEEAGMSLLWQPKTPLFKQYYKRPEWEVYFP